MSAKQTVRPLIIFLSQYGYSQNSLNYIDPNNQWNFRSTVLAEILQRYQTYLK
jgi:hypothetical protein